MKNYARAYKTLCDMDDKVARALDMVYDYGLPRNDRLKFSALCTNICALSNDIYRQKWHKRKLSSLK